MSSVINTNDVNVDKNIRRSGEHQYELRINKRVVCQFPHNREEPLHECLLKAAVAAEEKATPKKGMIRPLLEPLYDDVYFEGLKYLDSL